MNIIFVNFFTKSNPKFIPPKPKPKTKKEVKEVKENIEEDIFSKKKKETNEEDDIFAIPKKKVQPPSKTVVINKRNTNSKKNTKNLFEFEADNEEDIFAKKNGEGSIFDTDYNNDKDNIFG